MEMGTFLLVNSSRRTLPSDGQLLESRSLNERVWGNAGYELWGIGWGSPISDFLAVVSVED
jgi:hypothetical protein